MSKSTPGPWECHKNKRGYAILHPLINQEGEYKGKLGGYHVVVQERQLSPEGIETKLEKADAFLIAAAPDLLEVCKFAQTELERFVLPSHMNAQVVMAALDMAIAKAEKVE